MLEQTFIVHMFYANYIVLITPFLASCWFPYEFLMQNYQLILRMFNLALPINYSYKINHQLSMSHIKATIFCKKNVFLISLKLVFVVHTKCSSILHCAFVKLRAKKKLRNYILRNSSTMKIPIINYVNYGRFFFFYFF